MIHPAARHGRGQARAESQFDRVIAQTSSQECREHAGNLPMARDLADGTFRSAGAPLVCQGHCRGCCGTLEDQRVPPECAREGEEHVGVDRVAGDLAAGVESPVNGRELAVKRGSPV